MMEWIIGLIIVALVGLIYMVMEARYPHRTRVKLGDSGIKILNISDVHVRTSPTSWRRAKRIIQRSDAEMILFCGDYIQKPEDEAKFFRFIDYIADSRPMYAILGNHDVEAFMMERKVLETLDTEALQAYKERFSAHGINMLDNQSQRVVVREKELLITGLGDIRYELADFSVLDKAKSKRIYKHIVLAHSPDTMLSAQCYHFDYMFSGHFHAGQIWLPFNMQYRSLRDDVLCNQGVVKGVHKFKTKTLFINRGLGSVLLPFRFLSYPEIAEIEL